ncbi:nitroreductase/quinone reductase family protein [Streptomyces sp. NPDC093085]|uniref:nitroreductase/quinone reductase family protein n=1 Tax=Streptomyces sp. NPDC093085 TaxID=3155068 RepID=UPI00342A86C8
MPTSLNSFNSFNQSVIEEFRANAGKVGGPFEGGELLLLTTTGARSGAEHTVPLGCVRDGDLLMVIGSAGGADRHPAWYHNLLAHPMVRVEIGTLTYGAVAVPAEGARRDALFARAVAVAPGYSAYQESTVRTLPVVVLERSEPEPDAAQGPAGAGAPAANLAEKLLEVHTWLRAQLAHVRSEADAHFAARAAAVRQGPGAAAPVPGLGLQLRQHCLAFCQSLTFHHTGEDQHMFPALAGGHPELAGVFARLAEEHRTVARIQEELVALLAGVDTVAPDRFRAELDRMSVELTAHLAYEEEWVLPVLAAIPFPPRRAPVAPAAPVAPVAPVVREERDPEE